MKKMMLSGGLIAALCFATGCGEGKRTDAVEAAEESNEAKAEATPTADEVEDDAEFAVKAANGGMVEVELARLAATKATSQEVKTFAQTMMSDHTKANEEFKSLATQKNITLPAALSDESRKDVDRLSALTGTEFDKEYIAFMVEDHEDDVEAYGKAASDAKDADIKAFAAKTLPTLQSHLDMAKRTKETVDKMQ
ncbi:MAG: DUF4142 domain-containing protein [Ferruginibacter sp.]|nr:DUF4142 domain-containing protein [Cytophagales bacterium]